MQEGAEKEIQIDSDYYRTSLYNDVWAFRDGGVFRAYYDPYSDTYSEGIVESEERKLCIFLPGDIIRYELYDRTGDVIRVTPTFLSDAKVFKADDMGRMGPSYTRYRAFDLAVVNRIEGDTAELTYLIDKKDGSQHDCYGQSFGRMKRDMSYRLPAWLDRRISLRIYYMMRQTRHIFSIHKRVCARFNI